mmetsp:Transcript_7064/g.15067  ORF Transcript_7064/g.15067 Transcript_7064/m.15067 type:complete len:201 (+) Transcript_7064:867-1469(+)
METTHTRVRTGARPAPTNQRLRRTQCLRTSLAPSTRTCRTQCWRCWTTWWRGDSCVSLPIGVDANPFAHREKIPIDSVPARVSTAQSPRAGYSRPREEGCSPVSSRGTTLRERANAREREEFEQSRAELEVPLEGFLLLSCTRTDPRARSIPARGRGACLSETHEAVSEGTGDRRHAPSPGAHPQYGEMSCDTEKQSSFP